MPSEDYSARVSIRRMPDKPNCEQLKGKFLYVYTDSVYPGNLAGFFSQKKISESPSPDDRTGFNFERGEFFWYCIGAYPGLAFLLTTDLTRLAICSSDREAIKEATFSPRSASIDFVPLVPWETDLPDVNPTDRRDGSKE